MKMILRYAESEKNSEHAAELIPEAMTSLVHSPALTVFNERVEALLQVLLLSGKGPEFSCALQKLVYLEYAAIKVEIDATMCSSDASDIVADSPSIYMSSPFYKQVIRVFKRIKQTINDLDVYASGNELQSEVFEDYLMTKLVPNSSVENYFKGTKMATCEKNANVKAGRFIDTMYENITASYKEICLPKPVVNIRRKRP